MLGEGSRSGSCAPRYMCGPCIPHATRASCPRSGTRCSPARCSCRTFLLFRWRAPQKGAQRTPQQRGGGLEWVTPISVEAKAENQRYLPEGGTMAWRARALDVLQAESLRTQRRAAAATEQAASLASRACTGSAMGLPPPTGAEAGIQEEATAAGMMSRRMARVARAARIARGASAGGPGRGRAAPTGLPRALLAAAGGGGRRKRRSL